MKKILYHRGKYYHIINRGIQGLKIFKNVKDYIHFLHCMKEYNSNLHIDMRAIKMLKRSEINILANNGDGHIVDILGYCLHENHFHILLCQRVEDGIPMFMKKLGTGYAMYMNKFYNTSGHLFEGAYKAHPIATEDELLFFSAYVHLEPGMKKNGHARLLKTDYTMLKKVSQYPWSSIQEYLLLPFVFAGLTEIKNVKPKIDKAPVLEALGTQLYENYILNFWGKQSVYKIDKKFL
ncbi:MAG: hypothetical protein US74_C0018G0007 [Parcubacteria group bacterium GW2011_GWA2_38_13]|nr:MAG: hypothetical protein US74_C0018G0007 [Parcubacteria group bacterium GW2011_GWA2_38_13]